MMEKFCMRVFLGLLFSLPLAGCLSTSTGGLEVIGRENVPPVIRIDDNFFARHINVEDAKIRQTDAGFRTAMVCVQNLGSGDFPVQYKFTWFDSDGFEVQPGGRPWEQTILHGGERLTLSATAPESKVTRFTVHLRWMK